MKGPDHSWWSTYGEPVLGVVACVVALATLSVVARAPGTLSNDFVVFLSSARWLRQGADLYQHPPLPGPGYNLNTPALTLLLLPFSFLSDGVAFRLWTVVAVAAYLVSAVWIARTVAAGRTATIASMMFISQPVIAALLLGQVAGLLTLVMTAAWIADREDRPLLAGGLLGAAIAAKPFLGVFVPYLLWRRSPRAIGGAAVGAAGVLTAGWIAAGVTGYRSWLAALARISWTGHTLNASVLGLLTRTLDATPAVLHVTPVVVRPDLVQPLWWASVLVVVAAAGRALARTRDIDRAWALLVAGGLLISPLGWMYYLTLLTGPAVAVIGRRPAWARAALVAAYACLLVPSPAFSTAGAVRTLAIGSTFNWGLLLLFIGLAGGAPARERLSGQGGVQAVSMVPCA